MSNKGAHVGAGRKRGSILGLSVTRTGTGDRPRSPGPRPCALSRSSCSFTLLHTWEHLRLHPLPLLRSLGTFPPARPQRPGASVQSLGLQLCRRWISGPPGKQTSSQGRTQGPRREGRPERLCCTTPTTRGQSGPAAGAPGMGWEEGQVPSPGPTSSPTHPTWFLLRSLLFTQLVFFIATVILTLFFLHMSEKQNFF